jgi:hypothetical protein
VEHIREILRTKPVKNETFSKKYEKFHFCQFLPIRVSKISNFFLCTLFWVNKSLSICMICMAVFSNNEQMQSCGVEFRHYNLVFALEKVKLLAAGKD